MFQRLTSRSSGVAAGLQNDLCGAQKIIDAAQHTSYIEYQNTPKKTRIARKRKMATKRTNTAKASVEEFATEAQKTVTEGMEKMSKGFEDMTAFGQENMDAMMKSSEIAAKAAEGIGSEVSAFTKKAFEDGVAATQDLASAKTVTELMEKQAAFAQTFFDSFMSQATKMNEIYAASAKEIFTPLTERFNAVGESMKAYKA